MSKMPLRVTGNHILKNRRKLLQGNKRNKLNLRIKEKILIKTKATIT